MSAIETLRKLRTSMLLCLTLVIAFHSRPVTAQTCLPDGDVNQDGNLTPADALLAFQHFLVIANPALDSCQQTRANVDDPQSGGITPADALCIFQKFLSLPSCLDVNSRLIVTVVGRGRLFDPWPGIRVLRHDPITGAFIEERTTDASGNADFGDIGATRTTMTIIVPADDDDPRDISLTTYLDIPTGPLIVQPEGGDIDGIQFDINLTGMPEGSSEGVVSTGSHVKPCGQELFFDSDPTAGMVPIGAEFVDVEHLDANGLFGLLGFTVDDDGAVNAWGFLSDLAPDSVAESLVTIPMTGSVTKVPYTLDKPVENATSCLRINGLSYGIVNVIFAPEAPEESATGIVDVVAVPGADGFAFNFADIQGESNDVSPPGTPPDAFQVTISVQGRELIRSFSSIPASIAGTMPDLEFTDSSWDGSTKTLSWTLSGADVDQLAFVRIRIGDLNFDENESSWTLIGKPTLTSITLPGLPPDLADSVPGAPEEVDYSIEVEGGDNLANFDDFITSLSSVSGNFGALVYSGNRSIGAFDLNVTVMPMN